MHLSVVDLFGRSLLCRSRTTSSSNPDGRRVHVNVELFGVPFNSNNAPDSLTTAECPPQRISIDLSKFILHRNKFLPHLMKNIKIDHLDKLMNYIFFVGTKNKGETKITKKQKNKQHGKAFALVQR